MGLVLAVGTLPTIILLLVGGIVVDRFSRLQLMLYADAVRILIVGLMALLATTQRLELWHVWIINALCGTVDAFFYPAAYAAIPDIVAPSDLASANSLRSLGARGAAIIGPGLVGLLIAQGGTALAFTIDAGSFLISALCLLAIPYKQRLARPVDAEQSALHDLREGMQTVFQSPWLWVTITIAGLSNLTLSGPFEAVLPLLVKQHFGTSGSTASLYGLLMSIAAGGSIIAALWIGQKKRRHRRGYLAYGAWLIAGGMLIVMGLPLPVFAMGIAIFILDGGINILNLTWAQTLQELVPTERLGRVASIDALGSYALIPVGYALAGIAADHLSASLVFILGGIISCVIIGAGLLHPKVRSID
jgi:Arabinose efflux permease